MTLDHSRTIQSQAVAMPYARSPVEAATSAAMSPERLLRATQVALLAFLLICWVLGAYAGITYWAFQGSLMGVISSAIVPGAAAAATLSGFSAIVLR